MREERTPMRPKWRTLSCALGAGGLLLGVLAAGQGVAGASPVQRSGTSTCTGTLDNPGELTGFYENLDIKGVCAVQNGPVQVLGNLTVEPNASLNAVFGLKNSNLTVWGNMNVDKNATVMMGCDTVSVTLWGTTGLFNTPEFPCIDDPNGLTAPTLSSHDTVKGNLTAIDSLGVVLHNTQVLGNVFENGGGGGNNCVNQGIFFQDIGFPQYSGFFDGTINGNLTIENVTSCWYGSFRMVIDGSYVHQNVINNDPDGNEVSDNQIAGNMICKGNSPAIQFGDSNGTPSKVAGRATGECGFNVTALNPAPEAGVEGVTPVPVHISVPWRL
jgi:hypothetical protein